MSLDQDELNYEEQDDLGDFDNRMTQASESDKVRIQHDISQHQSWLELPFGKLKIYDQEGRMPVVNDSCLQFRSNGSHSSQFPNSDRYRSPNCRNFQHLIITTNVYLYLFIRHSY
jgi:hypothetical protein